MSRNLATIIGQVSQATRRMPMAEWNWSEGVALYGLVSLWKATKDDSLQLYLKTWIDDQLERGHVFETVNATAPCFSLIELYVASGEARYADIIKSRTDFLLRRAERLANGAFEHTLVETNFGGQMWVDTLFMAGLFLVKAGLLFNDREAVDEGLNQYFLHVRHLQQENGLYYHGWDERKNGPIGCLWARGNAWAAIVSAELLVLLPETEPRRNAIKDSLDRQLAGLSRYQDVSGLWTTVIDDPKTYLETSAAAGIAYAVKQALRYGNVEEAYVEMANRAARAALSHVDWEGVFRGVSAGTGVQKHAGEYHVIAQHRAEGYGQGLLLMLLSAMLEESGRAPENQRQ
ncbi:glycoside hydrolase 105 family protein [Paenibacillus sp. LMG 31461]|uniref:Glycoside hydrolase 105 family protein n=1 Tax=Paenibacillus plantarum TaxID=2654975 RepID=A0ABX1X310_9BACL|nr:glycoside hydrolase family 88 protein [Paenibacillus plantarum]NOU62787.1 glycoside hydrolase 105 family protein [Paenibacillus plantarum]